MLGLPDELKRLIFDHNRMRAVFGRMRRVVTIAKFRRFVIRQLQVCVDKACDDFLLYWARRDTSVQIPEGWWQVDGLHASELPFLMRALREDRTRRSV